jgi:hypothetical protein
MPQPQMELAAPQMAILSVVIGPMEIVAACTVFGKSTALSVWRFKS